MVKSLEFERKVEIFFKITLTCSPPPSPATAEAKRTSRRILSHIKCRRIMLDVDTSAG